MRGVMVSLAALVLPLQFAAAAQERHPTMQEMQAWKKDKLSQYEQVTYLDDKGAPITEDMFMRRAVEERSAFSMKVSPDGARQITIRFLPAEQSAR